MNITFKEHLVEEDDEDIVPSVIHHLEILYNSRFTKIIIEAHCGPSMVEAWIGFRPIHWSSSDEHRREKRIEIEGDIEDLKQWIMDNINGVFEFCFEEVIYLKSNVDECYDMLKHHLTEGML